MCLGFIVFNMIFHKNSAEFKPGKFTDMLMGPSFDALYKRGKECRPAFKAREKEIVEVTTSEGLKLPAYFYKCPVETDKTVILIHGYNSSAYNDYPDVAPMYLDAGFNVLCTNNRAGKDGDGNYTQFGTAERRDTVLWINELVRRYPSGDIFLHGCSMGGATVCLMSEMELPGNVRAILSDCAFASIRDELYDTGRRFLHFVPRIILGAVFAWYKIFFKHSVDEYTPIKAVAKAKLPILFIHGKEDRFINVSHARRLCDACISDKKIIEVDGAGHAAAFVIGGEAIEKTAVGWFKEHASKK